MLFQKLGVFPFFFFFPYLPLFRLYGSGLGFRVFVGGSREVCDGEQWQWGSDTCHRVGFAGNHGGGSNDCYGKQPNLVLIPKPMRNKQ